jgi:uncharacterized protein (TIGR02246 family)
MVLQQQAVVGEVPLLAAQPDIPNTEQRRPHGASVVPSAAQSPCAILPDMPEESTAPDLVELTRRAIEAANTKDVDRLVSFYAPDAVWEAMTGLGTHEGTAEIRRFFEDWLGAYEEFEVEVQEVLDLGNGVAFVVVVQYGRPVGSTGSVQLRYASVSVWVDGKIARTTNHTEIDEARAAAERLAEERG